MRVDDPPAVVIEERLAKKMHVARENDELDWDAWERPPVFEWLARHVDEDEMRRVFNLGIGFCAVVPTAEPGELVIGRIT